MDELTQRRSYRGSYELQHYNWALAPTHGAPKELSGQFFYIWQEQNYKLSCRLNKVVRNVMNNIKNTLVTKSSNDWKNLTSFWEMKTEVDP